MPSVTARTDLGQPIAHPRGYQALRWIDLLTIVGHRRISKNDGLEGPPMVAQKHRHILQQLLDFLNLCSRIFVYTTRSFN